MFARRQESYSQRALVVANNSTMAHVAANSLQTSEMLLAFTRIGLDVSFVWPSNGDFPSLLEGMPIRRLPINCLLKRADMRQVELSLRLLAGQASGKIPNAPLFTRNIGIALAAQLNGQRIGFELHDDVSRAMRPFLGKLGARVKLFPICHSLYERLRDHEGISPERMLVAHDGVDYDRFSGASPLPYAERPVPPGKFRFTHLYIGTLKPERGLDHIADAARQLPDHGFVLIGGSNDDVRSSLSRKLDLANVLVRPAVNNKDVPKLLKSYDTVLAPYTRQDRLYQSRSPLKLFEYLASGTPCIVSAIGSIAEIANDHIAWTFDPDADGDSLARAITACVSSPEEARARAKRGSNLVATDFTWMSRAQTIYDFLSN